HGVGVIPDLVSISVVKSCCVVGVYCGFLLWEARFTARPPSYS
ncbi:MAG: hypothetical protein PWP32_909, partial [Methanothermobacter sp.]|nr:hypothetical protein [Methanothermobacter sp.]